MIVHFSSFLFSFSFFSILVVESKASSFLLAAAAAASAVHSFSCQDRKKISLSVGQYFNILFINSLSFQTRSTCKRIPPLFKITSLNHSIVPNCCSSQLFSWNLSLSSPLSFLARSLHPLNEEAHYWETIPTTGYIFLGSSFAVFALLQLLRTYVRTT